MQVTTEGIQLLYEEHDAVMFPDFGLLLNGIREHIDRINTVCRLVHEVAPRSVLDIGCNRGLFGQLIRWNHQEKKFIVGVDISRLSYKYAKGVMGYDMTHTLNASEPFSLGIAFDLVLCMEILEHVPNPEQVVWNAYTHMCPGSIAIFSCPHELGEIDGEFHVRQVPLQTLESWVHKHLSIRDSWTLPSTFCEKPKWQGWHFVIATR